MATRQQPQKGAHPADDSELYQFGSCLRNRFEGDHVKLFAWLLGFALQRFARLSRPRQLAVGALAVLLVLVVGCGAAYWWLERPSALSPVAVAPMLDADSDSAINVRDAEIHVDSSHTLARAGNRSRINLDSSRMFLSPGQPPQTQPQR